MERVFCKDKKDFCNFIESCLKCKFAKGNGVISGYIAHDLLATLFGIDYDLSRLRELVQADRDRRCVVLPCKVGEILWCINSYGEVEETVAVGFLIEKESVRIYYKEKMSSEYYNAPLGKILFLTREAAEEALEGKS